MWGLGGTEWDGCGKRAGAPALHGRRRFATRTGKGGCPHMGGSGGRGPSTALTDSLCESLGFAQDDSGDGSWCCGGKQVPP
ncbi:MAG: hypothetical protein WAL56_14280, partial [Candidatus Sulfotelmatobacter sp.]